MKDLFLIERAYDLSHPSSPLSIENNLLNSWLAIEYIVTPYISNAIIEKVRQVIPKVVSLYYIKGLMNEVWVSLNEFNLSGNEIIADFIKECKDPDAIADWKYQKVKFAEQLKDVDKVQRVIDSVSGYHILIRKLRELNGLINNRTQVTKKLKNVHQSIEFDLNRIYRLRNKIVHSGLNVPNDLELVVIRLMKYNNHLLGTIIHYMTLNDKIDLEDVLNSIVESYNWYIDDKIDITDINDIVTPKYLYL